MRWHSVKPPSEQITFLRQKPSSEVLCLAESEPEHEMRDNISHVALDYGVSLFIASSVKKLLNLRSQVVLSPGRAHNFHWHLAFCGPNIEATDLCTFMISLNITLTRSYTENLHKLNGKPTDTLMMQCIGRSPGLTRNKYQGLTGFQAPNQLQKN